VKHGYVDKVLDWPYSTFHRYVELGVYPEDWASDSELELDADERSGVP
jgi:putative transposase